MRFRRQPKLPPATPIDAEKEDYLRHLDASMRAAEAAASALAAGKSVDCDEVAEARRLIRVVNEHPFVSRMLGEW